MTIAKTTSAILTKDFLQSVPNNPGVYVFKNSKGIVLYAGKARDLRKRLASYVKQIGNPHSKTGVMLSHAVKVETIITSTENEALLLESSLIKKHRPKYNVILRDDKNYPYIKVTISEKWPRVQMTRRRSRDGSRYFGPYSSSSAMWETLNFLNRLFPMRRCKGRDLKKRNRPCLNHQMGRCLAPCMELIGHHEYMEMVRHVILALEGRNRKLLVKSKSEMAKASKSLRYEDAAKYRDRINAIEKTLEKQVIAAGNFNDQDVFGFAQKGYSVAIAVLFVREGIINGRQSFFLPEPAGSNEEIIASVIERFYENDQPIPPEILLPFEPDDKGFLTQWLTATRGSHVYLRVPKRGNRLKIIEMANHNAEQLFTEKEKKEKSWDGLSAKIQENFHLRTKPQRMECIDISNIGGKQAVGVIVSFESGEKDKKNFRRYTIRTVQGANDYAMMQEVLERHFSKISDTKQLPDLLIVDGGKGQLSAANFILEKLNLHERIDLIGIAKEKSDEGEKIFIRGRKNPILLARHSPVLLIIMKIRDETHRFGITFHRNLRAKDHLRSELDSIPGVGPSRKKNLLTTLGSLEDVKSASTEKLASVQGISQALAGIIFTHLRKNPETS
ncbi:MAG: excinuclease ABC subunit UvrC [Proteobacteria bacterium]|nr:excinuclease ABC subunit UvrC [Pseudomonadota bacterium]MBU1708500.1 excinuclease ABC subunit UvrC [Pseudomonadota bacterium]